MTPGGASSGPTTGHPPPGTSSHTERNVAYLRDWASQHGWTQRHAPGPEVWGVLDNEGTFSWRLKIKHEGSMREGLQASSRVPRVDARLDTAGTYINPFTGQQGDKTVGTHIPLAEDWTVPE
jgi:hypothetical protein